MGLLLFTIGFAIFIVGAFVLLQNQQKYVWCKPDNVATKNDADFELLPTYNTKIYQ